MGQEAPFWDFVIIIISLFDYFLYVAHNRYIYTTTMITLAQCKHLLILVQFPVLLYTIDKDDLHNHEAHILM